MTVERLDVTTTGPHPRQTDAWWGVHAARYLLARRFVKGRRVLDIACGTGYGLSILLEEASAAVGADIDVGAAAQARKTTGDRAGVVVTDGTQLPFADCTFEVITSFETIEHLHDRSAFLGELRRVMAPAGVLVLSTPNANYTVPVNGKPKNPFHIHEYTPEDLRNELQAHFRSVEMLGQAIHPRFRISPFVEDQQRLPRTLEAQGHRFLWRVLNKMPIVIRNSASEMIWGHSFLPDEHDYTFTAEAVHDAPVLVAICRTSE
jgi:ubiquinone/menaquinone biosynthesis C-methylase UbiE